MYCEEWRVQNGLRLWQHRIPTKCFYLGVSFPATLFPWMIYVNILGIHTSPISQHDAGDGKGDSVGTAQYIDRPGVHPAAPVAGLGSINPPMNATMLPLKLDSSATLQRNICAVPFPFPFSFPRRIEGTQGGLIAAGEAASAEPCLSFAASVARREPRPYLRKCPKVAFSRAGEPARIRRNCC